MPAAHNIDTASRRGKGSVMDTNLLLSIPQVADLRADWVAANTARPERILSALGLPGFGRKFAAASLEAMARTGYSAHQVCLGGWGR
jgi:hypothetical protein